MSLSDWTIANPESAGLRSKPLREGGPKLLMSPCVHRIALIRPLQAVKGRFWPICEALADCGFIGSPRAAQGVRLVPLMRRYHFDEETAAP